MLQELAISMGDLLMPTIREIVSGIQDFVTYLNSLDESAKETIIQIALVAAAVGPVVLIVGKIITGIGSLITAIGTITSAIGAFSGVLAGLSAPVLGIVAAIGAVIAVIVLCVQHWDEIKAAASTAVEVISQKWSEFKTKITETWNALKANVATAVENMKNNVQNVFNAIKTDTINQVTTLKTNALNAFNNLKAGISNTVGNIKTAIINGFNGAVEFISSLPGKALGWGRDIINGLVDGIRNAIGRITDVMSEVADTIASFIHFSEPDRGSLANFHTFMPDMTKQLAQGIRNGIPTIESAMDAMTRSMVPNIGNMAANAGTTNNNNSTNTVTLNVYGAQGQDVTQLANEIQNIINEQVYSKGAVFA